MAAQPANTQISTFRTVRTRVNFNLHGSIKERAQRLGSRVVIAPGEEIDVYLTVDGSGTNAPGPNPAWRYGMPVTVNTRDRATLAEMLDSAEATAGDELDLATKQIVGTRQDVFLEEPAASVGDDLHQQIRDNAPPPRGLLEVV
jgi:hypothetical protein